MVCAISSRAQVSWAASTANMAQGYMGSDLQGTSWFSIWFDSISSKTLILSADNGGISIYSNACYGFNAIGTQTVTACANPGTNGSHGATCQADASNWPGDRHPFNTALDSRRHILWVVGGVCNSAESSSVTWALTLHADATTNTWSKYSLAMPGNGDGSTKNGTSMVYSDTYDVLIFSGYTGGATTDTFHFCPLSGNPGGALTAAQAMVCTAGDTWELKSQVSATNGMGSAFSSKAWDSSVSLMIQFGGYTPGGTWVPTTYVYDPVTHTFTAKSPASHPGENGNNCGNLYGQVPMVYVGTRHLTYAHDPEASPAKDWAYNETADTWTNLGNSTGSPSTCTSQLAYDSAANKLITWDVAGGATTIRLGTLPPAGSTIIGSLGGSVTIH